MCACMKFKADRRLGMCFGDKHRGGSNQDNPISDKAIAAMWAIAESWRHLQINQLEWNLRAEACEAVTEFLEILKDAEREGATAWWQVRFIGIDSNSGDCRCHLHGAGHGMDVCKFTERQQRWLRSYRKT